MSGPMGQTWWATVVVRGISDPPTTILYLVYTRGMWDRSAVHTFGRIRLADAARAIGWSWQPKPNAHHPTHPTPPIPHNPNPHNPKPQHTPWPTGPHHSTLRLSVAVSLFWVGPLNWAASCNLAALDIQIVGTSVYIPIQLLFTIQSWSFGRHSH